MWWLKPQTHLLIDSFFCFLNKIPFHDCEMNHRLTLNRLFFFDSACLINIQGIIFLLTAFQEWPSFTVPQVATLASFDCFT
jgi:hypothetical protein